MRIAAKPSHSQAPPKIGRVGHRIFGLLTILALLLIVALGSGIFSHIMTVKYLPSGLSAWVCERVQRLGHNVGIENSCLPETIWQVPGRLAVSAAIPVLHFDVKFKHMQKIHLKRQEALEKNILVQGPDDFVPASIRFENQNIPADIRLKGDWLDHLRGEKWSFRVHVKGDQQILGMRRFSIQNPEVRVFQGDLLFYETLRKFDVLAPHYGFIRVVINGDDIGVMAVEEHFSKELLERNGRKEGVIVRFDESIVWDAKDGTRRGFFGVYDDYTRAPVDAFRSSRVQQSPFLRQQYALAVGLLRGHIRGALKTSEAFDAERLGAFLGVAEFWGTRHTIRWHNLRFYLNPFTLRLEPIGFDADIDSRVKTGKTGVVYQEPITKIMLSDPEVYASFTNTLRQLAEMTLQGDLIDSLQEVQQEALGALRNEYVLLEPFELDRLHKRAQRLEIPTPEFLAREVVNPRNYPRFVLAYLVAEDGESYIELENPLPFEVEVLSIEAVDDSGNRTRIVGQADQVSWPLSLMATPTGAAPKTRRLTLARPSRDGSAAGSRRIEIASRIVGYDLVRTSQAIPYFPALGSNPFPDAELSEVLRRHPYLSLDASAKRVTLTTGEWTVSESIIVPEGYDFAVSAGGVLRFAEDAALIIQGTAHLDGTAESPVVLSGIVDEKGNSGAWQGAMVFSAPERSLWSHVIVENTLGPLWPGWRLTGGVTFYESDVTLTHATFKGSRGDDALNIVHSDFKLEDVSFLDARSDAFDADFTSGSVTGGGFRNIGGAGGGDALDLSGSTVTVDGTSFVDVQDKAVSVGEKSRLVASGLVIRDVGAAIVSKDDSEVEVLNSSIQRAQVAALMAYRKKLEYGPARLIAKDVVVEESDTPALAQIGSTLSLNGREIEGRELDVDALYEGVMKNQVSR